MEQGHPMCLLLPSKEVKISLHRLLGKTATGSSFRKSLRRLATELASPSLTRSTSCPSSYFCFSSLTLVAEPLIRKRPFCFSPLKKIIAIIVHLSYGNCRLKSTNGSQAKPAPSTCKKEILVGVEKSGVFTEVMQHLWRGKELSEKIPITEHAQWAQNGDRLWERKQKSKGVEWSNPDKGMANWLANWALHCNILLPSPKAPSWWWDNSSRTKQQDAVLKFTNFYMSDANGGKAYINREAERMWQLRPSAVIIS